MSLDTNCGTRSDVFGRLVLLTVGMEWAVAQGRKHGTGRRKIHACTHSTFSITLFYHN